MRRYSCRARVSFRFGSSLTPTYRTEAVETASTASTIIMPKSLVFANKAQRQRFSLALLIADC